MLSNFKKYIFLSLPFLCAASYHEQYRVPNAFADKWESYIFGDKEYIIENLPVSWENARILCMGHHNGTLAILDSKDKADFIAEALSESQLFSLESSWVGARRSSADDPAGYRWSNGVELRKTTVDILNDEIMGKHYPLWQNRTRVPIPEGGVDCVAIDRVSHDKPLFLDLPCGLDRSYVCERDARHEVKVVEMKTVRCRSGLYRVFDGRLNWHQAAAHCILRNMILANVPTTRCLQKLGTAMLKIRPSIENAWVGASGNLGTWTWLDSGANIFQVSRFTDVPADQWPPLRNRNSIKQSGCLQLDRHSTHSPVFLEARCERKMQFICYKGSQAALSQTAPPSDDYYYYVLIKQQLYWQHAYENCQKMNATLASIENADIATQLLLLMGENMEQPIDHIWVSGRLNMSKDVATDTVNYSWSNPNNGKIIPDSKTYAKPQVGVYIPPWLDEEHNLENSCLNLDRQEHLKGLVYGLPCDTPQYSICMIEKVTLKSAASIDSSTPLTSSRP